MEISWKLLAGFFNLIFYPWNSLSPHMQLNFSSTYLMQIMQEKNWLYFETKIFPNSSGQCGQLGK